MGLKGSSNMWVSAVILIGLGFIAAGASVPDEETIALGFFLVLLASSVLLGINWPKPRPNNLVSFKDFQAAKPRARI